MREREVKLLVPDDFALPALSDVTPDASLEEPEQLLIEDTYYDTIDLRLARWGCTLRHRNRDGWVVKVPRPSKGPVLDRDEVAFGGHPDAPPARALNLVSSLTRGVDVDAVARVRASRQVRRWVTDDGSVVAELADDEVRGTTPAGEHTAFREIEFELAPDIDGRPLRVFTKRLIAAGARPEQPRPEVVRVLGPAAQEPPDVAVTALPSQPTARQVIRSALAASTSRLLLQLPAARLGSDPEGVHQARVAARRMRSDLKTFAPLLDAELAARLGHELRWLIDELGAVRDADILVLKFDDLTARHPEIDRDAADRVIQQVVLRRRRDRRRLLRHLSDERAMALFDHLVTVSMDPPTMPRADRRARDVMPELVRKRWKRLDRAIGRLEQPPDPAELHAVRILAKRVRYASEAVAPATGKRAKRFARDAARIQDALGELNDAEVAASWLEEATNRLDGRAAYTAGRMAQLLVVEARTHDQVWRRSHRSMTKNTEWFS